MLLGSLLVGLLVGASAGLLALLWLDLSFWGGLLVGIVTANLAALAVLWWRARRR